MIRAFAIAAYVIAFSGGAIASTSQRNASSYEVTETGILGRQEAYWIDSERVLFPGFTATGSGIGGASSPASAVLYIWDSIAAKAVAHSNIPDRDYVCYADGFVSYAVLKDGKRYIREGRLGAETERPWMPSVQGKKVDRNEFTCKDFDYSSAHTIRAGFNLFPLRDGHGYWGAKRSDTSANAPMYYLFSERDSPIALPIKIAEKRRMIYSEFSGAYVVERSELSRSDTGSAPGGKAWLLFPNGKVGEMQIPPGPWLDATWGYAPTRKGWAISSRATGRRSNFDPGHAGVYLVNEAGVVERLVAGFPGLLAVSPDGCNIAVVVDPMLGPGRKATLRILRLCEQGNSHGNRFGDESKRRPLPSPGLQPISLTRAS